MTLTSWHRREQHPVGQGLFHSAKITVPGKGKLHYVYDCGAMLANNQGEAEAQAFAKKLRNHGEVIDAIFISHFHDDHINALPTLLHPTSGVRTRNLYLPLLDTGERIMRVAAMSKISPMVKAYAVFGAEGLQTALGLDEGTVVEVSSANFQNPDQTPSEFDSEVQPETIPWVDISDAQQGLQVGISAGRASGQPAVGRPTARLFDDQGVFIAINGKPFWKLQVYITVAVRQRITEFLNALNTNAAFTCLLGPGETVATWLEDVANRKKLFEDESLKEALRDAYLQVRRDLNLTSMSLYSGPAGHGTLPCRAAASDRFGWLGTGDAKFTTRNQIEQLVGHYSLDRLKDLKTLVMPHHGSDRNSSLDFLKEMKGAYAVFSYGEQNNYKHPGDKVLNAAESASMLDIHVTEDEESRWVERFHVHSS